RLHTIRCRKNITAWRHSTDDVRAVVFQQRIVCNRFPEVLLRKGHFTGGRCRDYRSYQSARGLDVYQACNTVGDGGLYSEIESADSRRRTHPKLRREFGIHECGVVRWRVPDCGDFLQWVVWNGWSLQRRCSEIVVASVEP